jgi:hypothetical protein
MSVMQILMSCTTKAGVERRRRSGNWTCFFNFLSWVGTRLNPSVVSLVGQPDSRSIWRARLEFERPTRKCKASNETGQLVYGQGHY